MIQFISIIILLTVTPSTPFMNYAPKIPPLEPYSSSLIGWDEKKRRPTQHYSCDREIEMNYTAIMHESTILGNYGKMRSFVSIQKSKIMLIILLETNSVNSGDYRKLLSDLIEMNDNLVITLIISRESSTYDAISELISNIIASNAEHIKNGRIAIITQSPYITALFGSKITASDVILALGGFSELDIKPEFYFVYHSKQKSVITPNLSINRSLQLTRKLFALSDNKDWCATRIVQQPSFLVIRASTFGKVLRNYWNLPFNLNRSSPIDAVKEIAHSMCHIKPDWKRQHHF
ncbi:uncharacterized protein LOC142348645 isoform X2 [Convolutriloba macropyga]|uniref:uncharacterized protein LOC142348645 isoform X2 n=1 Tax=Convolutriloba macropyga TaxID=536237 RepID=UPI003F51D4AA